MKCYACDNDLTTDNETDEHIIINAAGGRLKSKKLICSKCNSRFGETIDRVLAKQLNSVANMLMIQRQRGEPQPILGSKSTGEKYFLEVGGAPVLHKPTIEKTTDGDQTNISIKARNEEQLRDILQGYANKFPHFDVEEAMKKAKRSRSYMNEPLSIKTDVGGKEVFRAVCKCAMNFFIYKKGDNSHVKHLLPFIEGKEEQDVVWLHYKDDLYTIEPTECFHLIHLIGNSQEKVLYCYIDYFNTHKYLILLSDNYEGDEIDEAYSFDVINNVQLDRRTTIDYDRDTLLKFFSMKDAQPHDRVQKSFERTMAIALKRQDEFQRSKIIEQSIQNSLGKYPYGTLITEQMLNEMIDEIAKNIASYIFRLPKEE